MRIFFILFLVSFMLSACSTIQPPPAIMLDNPPPIVETTRVNEEFSLGFSSKLVGWTISKVVPRFLVEEYAHHARHELEEKGQSRSDAEIIEVVRKRLAANELYLYNRNSQAWVLVDLSALEPGEVTPGRGVVYDSARFAANSLAHEEGVENVVQQITSATLFGADHAFRLDADFLSHGQPRKFSGLIGFADRYWIYIYYTDLLADPDDYQLIDKMLDSMSVLKN